MAGRGLLAGFRFGPDQIRTNPDQIPVATQPLDFGARSRPPRVPRASRRRLPTPPFPTWALAARRAVGAPRRDRLGPRAEI